ncbi:hypothetical protein B0J17DRAFT_678441 [Rhizoctonia solani]|nr:hypothetical protein B0J17DRAFT_678441 [Rhizoctonia solani]
MGTTQSTSSVSTLKVTFPSLQYLYLEDLSPSTLKTVFTTITPGDYQVALHLTNRIHRTYDADTVAKSFIFASLEDILSLGHIHTLSIVGLQDTWLASDVFHAILKLLPTLKVLKLHGWSFMKPVWQALQRPGTRDHPVHLTQARIVEEDGLEEMIESHLDSIQLVELGARNATMARPNLRGPYQGSENIIVWLRSKVPKLYLTDPERLPRDLGSPIEWQSW